MEPYDGRNDAQYKIKIEDMADTMAAYIGLDMRYLEPYDKWQDIIVCSALQSRRRQQQWHR